MRESVSTIITKQKIFINVINILANKKKIIKKQIKKKKKGGGEEMFGSPATVFHSNCAENFFLRARHLFILLIRIEV